MQPLSDYELLVERQCLGVRLYGFDTYKHENRARSDELSRLRDELTALAISRGLVDEKTGFLTAKGESLNHESDARVEALVEKNRRFHERR